MSYRRVTWEDRIKIKLLLQQGKNKSEIAEIIGKDKSTVGREIKRNTGGRGYRPKQAQKFAEEREASKHRPYKMTERTCAEIKKGSTRLIVGSFSKLSESKSFSDFQTLDCNPYRT